MFSSGVQVSLIKSTLRPEDAKKNGFIPSRLSNKVIINLKQVSKLLFAKGLKVFVSTKTAYLYRVVLIEF